MRLDVTQLDRNEELLKRIVELLSHGKDTIALGSNSISVKTFKDNRTVVYLMPNLNNFQSKDIKKNR